MFLELQVPTQTEGKSYGAPASGETSSEEGDLSIGIVVQMSMEISKTVNEENVTFEWAEGDVKTRNLKPVRELIEHLLLQILNVDKRHKSEHVGLFVQGGKVFPLASFKIHKVALDVGLRVRIRDLAAAVPTLLETGRLPAVLMDWLPISKQEEILAQTQATLQVCGDRSVPTPIDVLVDGNVVATLRGRYAPKPMGGDLAPIPETFEGRVVGFSMGKGVIDLIDLQGSKREIRSKVRSLDPETLGAWIKGERVIAVNVETTTLPSGKLNHEFMSFV
jgi:hypothetical protein